MRVTVFEKTYQRPHFDELRYLGKGVVYRILFAFHYNNIMAEMTEIPVRLWSILSGVNYF